MDPDGKNIATAFLKGFYSSLYADIQSFSEFTTYASIGRFWGGDLGEKVGIAVYGIKTDIELYNTIVDNWPGINEFLHNPVDCVKKVYSEMSTEDKAEFLGEITEKIAAAIILSKATGGSGSKVKVDKPLKNHSIVNGRVGSLKIKGQPNSSIDLIDNNGKLLQRRFYGKNGKAKLDWDFSHGNGDGTHSFPHKHKWIWKNDVPVRTKE